MGRADAAMLSGPLDYFLAQAKKRSPCDLQASQLETLKLAATPKSRARRPCPPSNPIRSLTTVQLRGILSGEITSWKEVGGPDRPNIVILPDELDGVRATVSTSLLEGFRFASTARNVERTPDVIPLVAAAPDAIALLPRGTLCPDSTWAEIEPRLILPLYLVARRARLDEQPKLEMTLNSLQSRAR